MLLFSNITLMIDCKGSWGKRWKELVGSETVSIQKQF